MFQENFNLFANFKDKIFISYYKKFINDDDHKIFKYLEKQLTYYTGEETKIKMCGIDIMIPRKQVAYGEKGTSYSFSGTTIFAKDWNEDTELCKIILFIRNKIAKRYNFNPNFVLINRYEDGDQYIGYHTDNEKDLVPFSPIAGVSFGAEREMVFMNKSNSSNKKKLLLKNGSSYCIHYPTNANYLHSIPKTKYVKSPRISFTFREMIRK